MGIHDFAVFAAACVALWFAPGPDTMYIVARGVSQGRVASVVSALGITTGLMIHTVLAALGISGILAASATAFSVLKWGGAAYLIWLGLSTLLSSNSKATELQLPPQDSRAVFWQGLATNVLNPKVAIFFLALLPQFVDPAATTGPLPFILLGAFFVAGATVWNMVLALVSARAARSLRDRPSTIAWLERLAGLVYIVLGLRLLRSAPARG